MVFGDTEIYICICFVLLIEKYQFIKEYVDYKAI